MITKFNKYLITESPDNIKDEKGYEHWYEHDEARPFFVKVNSNHTKVTDVYIGKNATCHSEMKGFSTIVGKSYPGRIFIYNKLISFWVYPNEILFDSIIENLEEQLETTRELENQEEKRNKVDFALWKKAPLVAKA